MKLLYTAVIKYCSNYMVPELNGLNICSHLLLVSYMGTALYCWTEVAR